MICTYLGKNGERGKLGQDMLYVGCYDSMFLFNVCSLVLMIYWDIVRDGLGSEIHFIVWFKMRGTIV